MDRSLDSEMRVDNRQHKKSEYAVPLLTKYGSVAELTQGITGRYFDGGSKAPAASGRPNP